jgi:16S rRNA (guanine527-N7)-methyltransferase
MTDDAALTRVLSEIQRRGAIGRGPIDAAIAHARRFVAVLPEPVSGVDVITVDLGSGGGLPGLVIAVDRPDVRLMLIERREKRADLLRYGVRALDLTDRVEVVAADVETVITSHSHQLDRGSVVRGSVVRGSVDVVTARSFAPPLAVLGVAGRLLRPGGTCIISDPPDGRDRWTSSDLAALSFDDDERHDGVHRFRRH